MRRFISRRTRARVRKLPRTPPRSDDTSTDPTPVESRDALANTLIEALVENAPVAMIQWRGARHDDPDLPAPEWVHANHAAQELVGAADQATMRELNPILTGMRPEDRAALLDALRVFGWFGRRIRLNRIDGEERWVDLRAWWVRSERIGWATLDDVTAEVAMEAGLARSRASYQRLYEGARSGLFQIEIPSGRFTQANRAAARLAGFETGDALVRSDVSFLSLLDDDVVQSVRAAFVPGHRRSADESPSWGVVRLTRSNASHSWVRLELLPSAHEDLVEGVAIDVTEGVESRAALRENERLYRAVFENAVAGVVVARLSTRELVNMNDAAALLAGATSASAFRQAASSGRPEAIKMMEELIAELDASGEPSLIVEDRVRGLDGRERIVRIAMRVDREQDLVHCAVVDITAERRAQAAQRRLMREVEKRSEERRLLAQRVLRAAEDERRQVARDIHDGPTQHLTVATMFLETAEQARTNGEPDEADRRFEQGMTYLRMSLDETRRVMANLRPAALDDLGLEEALLVALRQAVEARGIELQVVAMGAERAVDRMVETALYRIAQEAGTNAAKHSGTTRLQVTLDYRDSARVQLSVRDFGKGFEVGSVASPQEGFHLGLVGMRERADLIDGTFSISSQSGDGTSITVNAPRWPGAAG